MRKTRRLLASVVFSISILTAGSAAALSGADVALYNDDVALYNKGAWQSGVTAIKNMLTTLGYTYEVITYTDLNSSTQNFSQLYKIILVPGGYAGYYNYWISKAGKQRIRDFVNAGGGYYGICAGAFFAVDRTIWEGTEYDDTAGLNAYGELTGYDLDLFPGSGTGPMNAIADWNTVGYNMTTVRFSSTSSVLRAYKQAPFTEDILYYGGPYFKADTGASVDVLATYDYNGEPAVVAFAYGSGRVILSGPHPEIEEDSDRDGVTIDRESTLTDNGSDWPLTNHLLLWLLKQSVAPAYSLWTRSDTGQAVLWLNDPTTGSLQTAAWLYMPGGVGAPWQATSYAHVSSSEGYVLWTRSDTGQAALWKVNPGTLSTTITVASSLYLYSSSGVGGPWRATSYEHVDATTGYVLWTRPDTGQAVLWKVNPSTGQVVSGAYLYSPSGVGSPWQATGYERVDDTTAYVLWTRSDTGQAVLWKVNPGAVTGTIPIVSWAYLYSPSGVGGPWQATGYERVNDTTAYVLWTRSDTGQAVLWKVNPGSVTGTIPIVSGAFLYSSSGAGKPWQATSVDMPK